jgi:hypothetical protein
VPNGFVVTALQAAYAAIRQTPVPADDPARHLQDALVAAVRIGHDTDTVAAIAGGLLGARWGASAVPATWREFALIDRWQRVRPRPGSYSSLIVATDHEESALSEEHAPLRYRLLTGSDDRAFCERISQALDDGYELYGPPAITTVGDTVRVAQAVVRSAS